ncbi:MAG: Gfo/Idh/MocA family oxidoreductase [Clostridiales bacterium]|nr:Gfo/Idh/MocA family oxidoreductase [Clostridiales bacterium]
MTNTKTARIGVIGAGGIANSVHLPSLKELPTAELVAICDLRPEKAEAAARKFGTAHTTTYWDMYAMLDKEHLDGVLVLVEPDRLFRVARDVMMHGLPVLMEKPAGISAHQANSLVRVSQEQGVVCAVAMNRRHVPLVQQVMKRMQEVTTLTQVDGMFYKNSDIQRSWDYASAYGTDGIHALDLVRYLAQGEVVDCSSVIGRYSGSAVDNAWASVMRFDNGVIGTMRSNYQTGARVHTFGMHGPGASAYINLGFGGTECDAVILYNKGGAMYSLASGGVGGLDRETYDGRDIAGSDAFHAYYGYKAEDEDFINAILTGGQPMCTVADAARSMELAEKLLASAI